MKPCYLLFPTCPSRNRIRKEVCDCFCVDAEFGPKIAKLSDCAVCPRAGTEEPVPIVPSFTAQPSDCDCNSPNLPPEEFTFDPASLPPGPGTELYRIFHDFGVPPCEQCVKLIHEMNKLGPDGCLDAMDHIVADIRPRAVVWIGLNIPIVPNIIAKSGATEAVL